MGLGWGLVISPYLSRYPFPDTEPIQIMRIFSKFLILLALLVAAGAGPALAQKTGNVIFFHPDGAGVNHWGALRFLIEGPDGELNWDKLPVMAVYKGHMKDALASTSHGGATVHAYGVKVAADSFGLDGTKPITAASGEPMSIMQEAKQAGKAIGLIQSGHIAEPGTAVFVSSVQSRSEHDEIARQVIESGAQVIMAGGERYMLPKGVSGHHGKGKRGDDLNLIERARELGYVIVYTGEELAALDLAKVDKLLGIFAHSHTFNAKPEEVNQRKDRPNYEPSAPSIAEMAKAALAILSRAEEGFLLVAEEEGTDNMANTNNTEGELQALARADKAIGVFQEFVQENPDTLMVMAADSDAGGMQIITPGPWRDRKGEESEAWPGGSRLLQTGHCRQRTETGRRSTACTVPGPSHSCLRRTERARAGHSPSHGRRVTTRRARYWCAVSG
jgi:alkaline phosphatase